MSHWVASPAVRFTSAKVLVPPAAPTWTSAAGNIASSCAYEVVPYYDGGGLFHSLPSLASVSDLNTNRQHTVVWNAVAGARWYKLFRQDGGTGSYYMVYSGPGTTLNSQRYCVDNAASRYTEAAPASDTTGTTKQTVDLGPEHFENSSVLALRYERVYEFSEPAINWNTVIKRFGFRPRLTMEFNVAPGSTYETSLIQIIGCGEAFPDANGYGVTCEFTCNYDAGNPTWYACDILGEWARTKASPEDVHTITTVQLEFVARETIPSIPNLAYVTAPTDRTGTV